VYYIKQKCLKSRIGDVFSKLYSRRTRAFQALRQGGTRNRLRVAAANKASKVKRLRAIQKHSTNGKLNNKNMMSKNNARVAMNVVDARVKLLQKALEKPTVMVDARQKLTKQKDAREKIQERRLHSSPYDVSNCLLITLNYY